MTKPKGYKDAVPVGTLDVHVKGPSFDGTVPARFLINYQQNMAVWAEFTPTGTVSMSILPEEVQITAPGRLEGFPAVMNGVVNLQERSRPFFVGLIPLREPLEASPAKGLTEVSFALLDSPIAGVSDLGPEPLILQCGQFDIKVTTPTAAHVKISRALGPSPHRLTNSVLITERFGKPFSSADVRIALDTFHTAASFAAGHWIGMILIEGKGPPQNPAWFRWGRMLMSPTAQGFSWYDPRHTVWLKPLCNAFRQLQSNDEVWEPIKTALYWYQRSNNRGAGIDSSLILSQCALELLSWFVIVKKTGALSEEGYGQLGAC